MGAIKLKYLPATRAIAHPINHTIRHSGERDSGEREVRGDTSRWEATVAVRLFSIREGGGSLDRPPGS